MSEAAGVATGNFETLMHSAGAGGATAGKGHQSHNGGMGLLAQEFARNTTGVLAILQRAYADEWFAHYNYYFVSKMVIGPSSESVAAVLRTKSDAALARADR